METLPALAPALLSYTTALFSLGAVCLITLIQNALTAPLAFAKEEQIPGMPLKHDHDRLSFRAVRTYENSAESLPAFGFAVLVAIAVGVSATWVNTIAALYLASRVSFWAVYYAGLGKVAGGPRTMAYVIGLLANITLVLIALWQLM